MFKWFFRWFLTIIYFWIFFKLIDLFFRNTMSFITDILAIICLIIAFGVSAGLADYTVRQLSHEE